MISTSLVSVLAAPTALFDASPSGGARAVKVVCQNDGAEPIFIGGDDVTTLTGITVPVGSKFTLEVSGVDLYAVAATAGQSVRVLVLAD